MGIKLLILTLFFLFIRPFPVFAVTVTISNTPQEITEQPFTFNVSITGASSATNYLKVDFFQPNDSNYFGYTYNGTAFYNGSDHTQYLPVIINTQGYSGTIQAKIDTTSSKFIGNGPYNLRIRRYTQSGNYSANESNIISLNITIPSPSPILNPSPSLSPTPSPTFPTPSPTLQQTASFTISDIPNQINSNQTFNIKINLSLPNNPNTDYYLKGAFKKTDASRYLGLTKNGNDWIEYGEEATDQFKITTDPSGSWTGNLEVKPDILDKDYKGAGDYLFKAARLTSSGSTTWSNEAAIKINAINNPSPTPSQISSPIPTKTATASLLPKIDDTQVYRSASIAGTSKSIIITFSPSPSPQVEVAHQKQINPFVWIGAILIFASVITLSYIYFRKNAKIPFKF